MLAKTTLKMLSNYGYGMHRGWIGIRCCKTTKTQPTVAPKTWEDSKLPRSQNTVLPLNIAALSMADLQPQLSDQHAVPREWHIKRAPNNNRDLLLHLAYNCTYEFDMTIHKATYIGATMCQWLLATPGLQLHLSVRHAISSQHLSD